MHNDMNNTSKPEVKDFINLSNTIYKSPNIQNDRIKAACEIVNSRTFTDYYNNYIETYGDYIASDKFNKNSALSEANTVFKLIEMLANSILFTADVKKINMKRKELNTKEKLDIKINRENKFDDYNFTDKEDKPMATDDKMDLLFNTNMQDTKNFYHSKAQVINSEDYHDADFNSSIYVFSANNEIVKTECISNMLKDYEMIQECFKEQIKANISNPRVKKRLSLLRAGIRKDQIELKNIIKRPIYIK